MPLYANLCKQNKEVLRKLEKTRKKKMALKADCESKEAKINEYVKLVS
jgi:hypothetical protein